MSFEQEVKEFIADYYDEHRDIPSERTVVDYMSGPSTKISEKGREIIWNLLCDWEVKA